VLDHPLMNGVYYGNWIPVRGWAVDLNATSGTGVGAVHLWALPTDGGQAMFVGWANMDIPRPDVAAALNRSEYASSGFYLDARLPPGTYQLKAFAWTALTGAFNYTAVPVATITVLQPPSEPYMATYLPAQQQVVTRVFTISGWGIDRSAPTGPGTSEVHAWAFPASGNPILAGTGPTGVFQQNVANVFGQRFGFGGFAFTATLPPGDYNLVVYVLSTVTGTFNQWEIIRIRVV
jgi:hypothetical protein